VSGNLLFVLCHEMAHAAMTQMGLPVLGRVEDAADSFAAVRMIGLGTTFSHRVLAEAAKGWFLQDRRDQRSGNKIKYYDEHGIDRQRAYQIVCLMVGSNRDKFKDLASETKLPESRQNSCAGDYDTASYSWNLLLEPHRRAADQSITKIDVVYSEAKGRLKGIAQAARSTRMLETVAQNVSEELTWPEPLTMEMQSCGFPNASWDPSTRKLTLCYELAADFEELYNAYDAAAAGLRQGNSPKNRQKF
jgi:Putative metallopeptidase